MSSPFGPTLANIFMGYLEYKILPEFNLSCKYVRYVDDCFTISDSEKVSSLMFEKLNSLRSALKFTKEFCSKYKLINLSLRYLENLRSQINILIFNLFVVKEKNVLMKTFFHTANRMCSQEVYKLNLML